jgi:hypothetical protein
MWRLVLQQAFDLPSRIWDWLHDAACQSFQTPSQCAGNVEIFIISEPFCLIRPVPNLARRLLLHGVS